LSTLSLHDAPPISLQVKYTFADTAEWSDGTPVDAADLVMYWGAKNQRFNTVEAEYDEDFEVTNEEEVEAGVFFNATSASVSLIEEFPEISDDGKSVTFTYTQPFGDWEVNKIGRASCRERVEGSEGGG